MALADGYHEIPRGRIAAVVTSLEMHQPPEPRPLKPFRQGVIRRVEHPALDWYRGLFREIGANWLWWSRLQMNDTDLAAVIHDPKVEVFALDVDGADRGLLELDGRYWPDVELAFFGVVPTMVGAGAGTALMAFAMERVWSGGAGRFWLHTCSLDHPRALDFYRAWGFRPYARRIEIAPDPRLTGVLPRDSAPQIPVIEP